MARPDETWDIRGFYGRRTVYVLGRFHLRSNRVLRKLDIEDHEPDAENLRNVVDCLVVNHVVAKKIFSHKFSCI